MPLAKAAAAKGLSVIASPPLSRGAEENKDSAVSPALVARLFAAKPGDIVTANDATGAYTAQLKEIQAPETPPDAALAGLSDQLAGEQRQDIAGEFTAALRRRYPVDIKRDALDRMF